MGALSHEGKNIDCVWEQGAEENIWTYEVGSDRRLEKAA
jgi:hypothetical protein